MRLYKIRLLRRLFLPLFSRLNPGDIYIKHHFTGSRVFLHSFKHKGYWYHGRNKERDTMNLFGRLVGDGDTVIEAGGHIGYVSLYFSQLVGDRGHVYVFEPGPNNLPYIRRNLESVANVVLIPKAVGSCNGRLPFYIENLTGQNNSLIKDYHMLKANLAYGFVDMRPEEIMVDVIRLDDLITQEDVKPDFVKLDVEGAELDVINGMPLCLKTCRPWLMIEITRNHQDLYDILTEYGYVLYDSELHIIESYRGIKKNTFCFHRHHHSSRVAELGLDLRG